MCMGVLFAHEEDITGSLSWELFFEFLLLLFIVNVITKLIVFPKYVPGYLDCDLSRRTISGL